KSMLVALWLGDLEHRRRHVVERASSDGTTELAPELRAAVRYDAASIDSHDAGCPSPHPSHHPNPQHPPPPPHLFLPPPRPRPRRKLLLGSACRRPAGLQRPRLHIAPS